MSPYTGINIAPFLPEFVLAGGLLALLVLDLIARRSRGVVLAVGGAVLLLAIAIIALNGEKNVGGYLFNAVIQDGLTQFFRIFASVATVVAIGILAPSFKTEGEIYILMVASVLGMFLLAGANDIVTLFVALEMLSIPSYVMAGYRREDPRSGEAALKYVIYGAMASGLMLYGFSLLYGLTGQTGLQEMAFALQRLQGMQAAQLIGLILVLGGIGYKIAMVPMHFWCPDVYEGSPTGITAFFSVAPKAAGFAALLRLVPLYATIQPYYGVTAVGLFSVLSAMTMTFGNLGAIWQDSVKRLLAYSSIAHAGYLLMGIAVLVGFSPPELQGLANTAILFYLIVYLFMNFGAFLIVDLVERKLGGDDISYFRGLGKTNPLPALVFAVCLFSLIGLPPLAGFIGKFYLFAAVVKAKLWALAMIGIANSVVSLFYYVRIIRDMFLLDPVDVDETEQVGTFNLGALVSVLMLAMAVPTLVLGVWWGPLAEWVKAQVM